MPNDREQWLIGVLDVNDGDNFDMEIFVFTPAQKKPSWVSSNDADGDALARESHYTNAYVEMEIRVAHQVDTAAALAKLGELTDAVQGCEREEGGRPCPWTPNGTETTYTAYALSGDITELPIAVAGEEAGWFIDCPKVKVKLTLRPFLERPERTVLASTESAAAPLQEVFVGGIQGDVPALGRLIITDKSGQNRRFAAWGRDIVGSEEPPSILITAASLTTTGFSGEAKTRSGAYPEEKVKRATAVSSATTMCGTGRIKHVGSFAVYMRVYAASENARFRISYRNGDGPLIPLKWVTPPVIESFSELYMGEVFLDEVALGEQTSEIRVECKSAGASLGLDVNYLSLWPTRASLTARGRANNTPTKLLAYDEFLQTEGALSGKTLPVGGAWSGAGDADDFTVIAANDVARRTALSDANIDTGRYGLAGSSEYTTVKAEVTVDSTTFGSGVFIRWGVFARYVNPENWLMAAITADFVGPGGSNAPVVRLFKRVGGTVTTLGSSGALSMIGFGIVDRRVGLQVSANGTWSLLSGTGGVGEVVAEGLDADCATAGTLAKGRVGIYDAWTVAVENTRIYSDFVALGTDEPGVVCYSGKSIEFNNDGVLRQDATGTYEGQPDLPRGSNFYLEPAGDNATINRVVTRMRRNDIVEEADVNVTDKHSVEGKATERFLVPR